MSFGSIPYKRAWYAATSAGSSGEMRELIETLLRLKNGQLKQTESLVRFLSHNQFDVRQYAHQLFADVCSNQQVHFFEEALNKAESLDEIRRIILRLGQTLSLHAIPILLAWRNELDNTEMDQYVCDALGTIFPLNGVNQRSIGKLDVIAIYKQELQSLDDSAYYYRGKPLFIGDITKELIVACTGAYKEKKPAILSIQPQILSNFSGMQCPTSYGKLVLDGDMQNVLAYVGSIAEMPWKTGCKYFFRNEIVGQLGH